MSDQSQNAEENVQESQEIPDEVVQKKAEEEAEWLKAQNNGAKGVADVEVGIAEIQEPSDEDQTDQESK